MTDIPVSLGPCCICKATDNVRNIIMLKKKAPIPGRGWGCLQCGLPQNGAIIVLCDFCLMTYRARGEVILKYACRGFPASDGRIPIQKLQELPNNFEHDLTKHKEKLQ